MTSWLSLFALTAVVGFAGEQSATEARLGEFTLKLLAHPSAGAIEKPIQYELLKAGKSIDRRKLIGRRGWEPNGALLNRPMQEAKNHPAGFLVMTYSAHGGSGTVKYLHWINPLAKKPAQWRLETSAENIHEGEFFLAESNGGSVGIVVTRPLMDAKSRAASVHFEIASYGWSKEGVKLTKRVKTANRYGELVPLKIIQKAAPKDWNLTNLR